MSKCAIGFLIVSMLSPAGWAFADPKPQAARVAGAPADRQTITWLNGGGFQGLVASKGLEEADLMAIDAIRVAARDTWPVEQLQRQRVDALLRAGKPDEALSAAKALFLV